ncbi:MAG: class I SAM-dependent methyltransferase [Actinomycetota bacterium]
MTGPRDELRAFYEHEAHERRRGPVRGRRVELRDRVIRALLDEGRRSIVDFGAGPGGDGAAFVDAGLSYVGVDLAHGNARLAAEAGLTVVQGSIAEPPLRAGSFDAGWSMSTLMHLPAPQVTAAAEAMVATLQPGAPFTIGQWGGTLGDITSDEPGTELRRLFSLRSIEANRDLLAPVATIEHSEPWDVGPDGWEYHVIRLRTG